MAQDQWEILEAQTIDANLYNKKDHQLTVNMLEYEFKVNPWKAWSPGSDS